MNPTISLAFSIFCFSLTTWIIIKHFRQSNKYRKYPKETQIMLKYFEDTITEVDKCILIGYTYETNQIKIAESHQGQLAVSIAEILFNNPKLTKEVVAIMEEIRQMEYKKTNGLDVPEEKIK